MQSAQFDHVLAEYLTALESDDPSSAAEVISAHPQFAEEFAQFLRTNELLAAAMGDSSPRGTAPSQTSVEFGTSQDARSEKPTSLSFPDDPTLDPATDFADDTERGSASFWSLLSHGGEHLPIHFGEYLLLREIDRGGMGIVFQAQHQTLNRTVALKVVRSGEMATEEELKRFKSEAKAAAAMSHPNIVPIYEVGEVRGLVYFTMGYVDGQDLTSILKERVLTPREGAIIIAKVADAIAAAHRLGIVHRDLKPSNILIDQAGEPYLIDFGLAKIRSDREDLTCTGQVLGTPAYMAPEQAAGKAESTDTSLDVYALGAVLYALVTRQAPFSGPGPFDVLLQVLDRQPPSPRKINSKVPRPLEKIILKAMEKDPSDRYPSAKALHDDLERFLCGEPIERTRQSIAEQLVTWWRREPILVSHVVAIGFGLLVRAIPNPQSTNLGLKLGILAGWMAVCYGFQRWSRRERSQMIAYYCWAATDVALFTWIVYLADPPRGLLFVGYPLMIGASGLFYRARLVVWTTCLCIVGSSLLIASASDNIGARYDYFLIYESVLAVLGLGLVSMIRRVRGLVGTGN